MDNKDQLNVTTVSTTGVTPEMVEQEARRFAMRSGGILLIAMAEHGLTEKQLGKMLEVNPRQIRTILMGENWRAYLPVAALCLALNIKMELKASSG